MSVQVTIPFAYYHHHQYLFDCLSTFRYVSAFRFKDDDLKFLKARFPEWEDEFFQYLGRLDTKQVKIFAVAEGSFVFPREPLLRIEGPLLICQLLETSLLVLVNYASLVCTNAARHRLIAGPDKTLLEFGLR